MDRFIELYFLSASIYVGIYPFIFQQYQSARHMIVVNQNRPGNGTKNGLSFGAQKGQTPAALTAAGYYSIII